jgi:4-hydroxybenzoate polyprenyltransferase
VNADETRARPAPTPVQFSDVLAILRPAQWIKNGFVLAALVFSLHLTDNWAVWRTLAAFLVFCIASSSAYVWNDILDASRDGFHDEKKDRPIPAGRISSQHAMALAVALASLAVAGAAFLGLRMVVCVSAFLALQAGYSLAFKNIPVVDVVSIAAGFVLRTAAGVVAARAQMSAWLFLATFLLALFLALAKRRCELIVLGEEAASHRPVLDMYRRVPLDAILALTAFLVVALYTQYTLDADVAERLGTRHLYLTVPFVVCGVFRYLFLVYGRDQGGNPTEALYSDSPLLAAVALWAASVVVLIYS